MLCKNPLTLLATTLKSGTLHADVVSRDTAIKLELSEYNVTRLYPEFNLELFKSEAGIEKEPNMLNGIFALMASDNNKVLLVELPRVYRQQEPLSQNIHFIFPFDLKEGKILSRTSNTVKRLFPEFYARQCHAKDVIAVFDKRTKFKLRREAPPLKRFSNENFKQRMA